MNTRNLARTGNRSCPANGHQTNTWLALHMGGNGVTQALGRQSTGSAGPKSRFLQRSGPANNATASEAHEMEPAKYQNAPIP